MKLNQSPCEKCKRCKDPKNCENKSCSAWREWWLGRWERIRNVWLMARLQGDKR